MGIRVQACQCFQGKEPYLHAGGEPKPTRQPLKSQTLTHSAWNFLSSGVLQVKSSRKPPSVTGRLIPQPLTQMSSFHYGLSGLRDFTGLGFRVSLGLGAISGSWGFRQSAGKGSKMIFCETIGVAVGGTKGTLASS